MYSHTFDDFRDACRARREALAQLEKAEDTLRRVGEQHALWLGRVAEATAALERQVRSRYAGERVGSAQ